MPDISRPVLEELAKIEDQLVDILKDKEQFTKQYLSYLKVEGQIKRLEAVEEKLDDLEIEIEAGGANQPDLMRQLDDLVSKTKSVADDWQVLPGADIHSADWTLVYGKVSRLAEANERKKPARVAPMKQGKQTLTALVDETTDAVAMLKEYIQTYQSKMGEGIESLAQLAERTKQLEKQLRRGSDVYRTFLNSLHVRTDKSNVLLFPVYRGRDDLQKRVQEMMRGIYSQYGELTIIPVNSDHLIEMSGAIHCLTQTIPEGVHVFSDDWDYRSNLKKN